MRYEVVESKVWRCQETGRTASIFGTLPPGDWEIEKRGWTIRDNDRGTVGLGGFPYATEEEAQEVCDKLNAKMGA